MGQAPEAFCEPKADDERCCHVCVLRSECWYGQIERETFPVVSGVTKFRQCLMGRTFVVKTDYRPLALGL